MARLEHGSGGGAEGARGGQLYDIHPFERVAAQDSSLPRIGVSHPSGQGYVLRLTSTIDVM